MLVAVLAIVAFAVWAVWDRDRAVEDNGAGGAGGADADGNLSFILLFIALFELR